MKVATNYLKNVGKSTVYLASDVAKEELMPDVVSFIETNSAVFKSALNVITHPTTSVKNAINRAIDSDLYKAIDAGARNAFEDLRTGNFYNKAREDKSMDDFIGADDYDDLSDFGIDGDWEKNIDKDIEESADISAGDKIISDSIEKSSAASTNTTTNAIISAAEYNVKTSRANTNAMMQQNQQLMTGIHKDISILGSTMDTMAKMQASVLQNLDKNASGYFTSSLKTMTEIRNDLKELLAINREAYKSALKKQEDAKKDKKQKKSWSDISDGDFETLFEVAKDNVIEMVGGSGMSDMFKSLGSMGNGENPFMMFAANPIKEILLPIAKDLVPATIKMAMNELNDTIMGAFSTAIAKMNNAEKNDSGGIFGLLGKLFKVKIDPNRDVDASKYEKGPVPFDGLTRKAIIDVIPAYLRRIESALTGNEEKIFDYGSGRWTSHSNIKRNADSIRKNAVRSGSSQLRKSMAPYTKAVKKGMESAQDAENFDKALEELEEFLYMNNGEFNPKASFDKNGIPSSFSNLRKHYKQISLIMTYLQPSTLLGTSRNVMDAKRSEENQYRSIENDLTNVLKVLYTGDTFNAGGKFSKDKYGNDTIYQPKNHPFLSIKDDNDMSLMDYLRNIAEMQRDIINNTNNIGRRDYPSASGNNAPTPPTPPSGGSGAINNAYNKYSLAGKNKSRQIYESEQRKLNQDKHYAEYKRAMEKGEAVPFSDEFNEMEWDMFAKSFIVKTDEDDPSYYDYDERLDDEEVKKIHKMFSRIAFNERQKVIEDVLSDKKYDFYNEQERIDLIKKEFKKKEDEAKGKEPKDDDNDRDIDSETENKSIFERIGDFTKKVKQTVADISEAPTNAFVSILQSADRAIYNMFYDTVLEDDEDADGSEGGFIPFIAKKVKNTFSDLTKDIKDSIIDPLKEKLGVDDKFKDRLKKSIGGIGNNAWNFIKDSYTELYGPMVQKVKEELGIGVDEKAVVGRRRDRRAELQQTIRNVKDNKNYNSDELFNIMKSYGLNLYDYESLDKANAAVLPLLYKDFLANTNKLKEVEGIGDLSVLSNILPNANANKLKAEDIIKLAKGLDIDIEGTTADELGASLYSNMKQQAKDDVESKIKNKFKKYKYRRSVGSAVRTASSDNNPFQDLVAHALYGDVQAKNSFLEKVKAGDKYPYDKAKYDGELIDIKNIYKTEINNKFRSKTAEEQEQLEDEITKALTNENISEQELKDLAIKLGSSDKDLNIAIQKGSKDQIKYLRDLYAANHAKGTKDGLFKGLSMLSKDEMVINDKGITRVGKTDAYDITRPSMIIPSKDSRDFYRQVGLNVEGPDKTPEQDLAEENRVKRDIKNNNIAHNYSGTVDITKNDISLDTLKTEGKKYSAEGIAGGLVGAIVSTLFGVVGGPLVGAVVGASANIIKNSDKLKDSLFGKTDKDGERKGGIIKKTVIDTVNKYAPNMAKYGIAGILPGLITPLGPLGGLLIGAGIGAIKSSEEMNQKYFGEGGKLRLTNETEKHLKEMFPKAIKGAGIGGIAGLFLPSPFGFMGNAIIGAGLGLMSHTSSFEELLLGKEVDGKRVGGLLGVIKTIFEPIKDAGIRLRDKFMEVLDNNILDPSKRFIEPFINGLYHLSRDIPKKIAWFVDDRFFKPLRQRIMDSIIGPAFKTITGFGSKLAGGLFNFITSPFKLVGKAGDVIRNFQIDHYNDEEHTAEERIKFREGQKGKVADAFDVTLSKIGKKGGISVEQAKALRDNISTISTMKKSLNESVKKDRKDMNDYLRAFKTNDGGRLSDEAQTKIMSIINKGGSAEDILRELSYGNYTTKPKDGKFFSKGNLSKDDLNRLLNGVDDNEGLSKKIKKSISDLESSRAVGSLHGKSDSEIFQHVKKQLVDMGANPDMIKNFNSLPKFYRLLNTDILNAEANPEARRAGGALVNDGASEQIDEVNDNLREIINLIKGFTPGGKAGRDIRDRVDREIEAVEKHVRTATNARETVAEETYGPENWANLSDEEKSSMASNRDLLNSIKAGKISKEAAAGAASASNFILKFIRYMEANQGYTFTKEATKWLTDNFSSADDVKFKKIKKFFTEGRGAQVIPKILELKNKHGRREINKGDLEFALNTSGRLEDNYYNRFERIIESGIDISNRKDLGSVYKITETELQNAENDPELQGSKVDGKVKTFMNASKMGKVKMTIKGVTHPISHPFETKRRAKNLLFNEDKLVNMDAKHDKLRNTDKNKEPENNAFGSLLWSGIKTIGSGIWNGAKSLGSKAIDLFKGKKKKSAIGELLKSNNSNNDNQVDYSQPDPLTGKTMKMKQDSDGSIVADESDNATKSILNANRLKEKAREKAEALRNRASETINKVFGGEDARGRREKGFNWLKAGFMAILAAPIIKKVYTSFVKPILWDKMLKPAWTNHIKPFLTDKVAPWIKDKALPAIFNYIKSGVSILADFTTQTLLPTLINSLDDIIGGLIRNLPKAIWKVGKGIIKGIFGLGGDEEETDLDVKENKKKYGKKKTTITDESGKNVSWSDIASNNYTGDLTNEQGDVITVDPKTGQATFTTDKTTYAEEVAGNIPNAMVHQFVNSAAGHGGMTAKISRGFGKVSNALYERGKKNLKKGAGKMVTMRGGLFKTAIGGAEAAIGGVGKIASGGISAADKAGDTVNAVVNRKAGESIDDVINSVGKNSKKTAKNVKNAVKAGDKLADVADAAGDAKKAAKTVAKTAKKKTGIVAKILKKVTDFFDSIFSNSTIMGKLKSAAGAVGAKKDTIAKKIKDKVYNFIKKAFSGSMEKIEKKVGKSVLKNVAGKALTIITIVADFLAGCDKAESMLEVSETSIIEEVVAGLVNALCEFLIIPSLLGWTDDIIQLIFGIFSSDLEERQKEAKKEAQEYNKKNGTNLTTKEYLEQEKSIGGKVKKHAKKAWKGVKKAGKSIGSGIKKAGKTVAGWFGFGSKDEQKIKSKLGIATKSIFGRGTGNEDELNLTNISTYQSGILYNILQSIVDMSRYVSFIANNMDDNEKTTKSKKKKKYGKGMYAKQNDPSISGIQYNAYGDTEYQTIGDSGCGPTAAVNAVKAAYGRGNNEVVDAAKLAVKGGYKELNGGTEPGFFDEYFTKNGLGSKTSYNKNELANSIMNGEPTVIMGSDKNGTSGDTPFGKNPHYVTVTGVDGRGNAIVQDPESKYDNQVYSMDKLLDKTSFGVSAYGKSKKTKNNYDRFNIRKNIKRLSSKYGRYKYGRGLRGSCLNEQAYNFFIDNGFTPAASAGIVGNLMAEAGVDKTGNIKTSSVESNGEGVGIVQWSFGRKKAFIQFCSDNGQPWPNSSLELQLRYIMKELNDGGQWIFAKQFDSKYKIPFAQFKTLTDPSLAAGVWCACYERPNIKYAHLDKRISNAVSIYNQYSGNAAQAYDAASTITNAAQSATNTATTSSGGNEADNASNSFAGMMSNIIENSAVSKALNAFTGAISGDASSTPTDASSAGATTSGAPTTTASGGSGSAAALINAAAAELGYTEKKSNSNLNDKTANAGANNWTKYGEWYGMNNVPWCAEYVSYSANQAGIDTNTIPKYASTKVGYQWFKDRGQVVKASESVPGDIAFFANKGSSNPSTIHHTGIIESNNGGKLYTLEGNTSNKVARRSYDNTAANILIGRPKYAVQSNVQSADLSSQASSGDTSYGNTRGSDHESVFGKGKAKKLTPIAKYNKFKTSRLVDANGNSYSVEYDEALDNVKTTNTYGKGILSKSSNSKFNIEEVVKTIIQILSKIADNTDKLSTIIQILKESYGIQVSSAELSEASIKDAKNENMKSKLTNALSNNNKTSNTSGSEVNEDEISYLLNIMNAIASE